MKILKTKRNEIRKVFKNKLYESRNGGKLK